MNKEQYKQIEAYMVSCMGDMVHDTLHIYRVVNYAARICGQIKDANLDIVIASALLHDIGRPAENANPSVCHAEVGSQMAYDFLTARGYDREFAERVRSCILSHRHKKASRRRA